MVGESHSGRRAAPDGSMRRSSRAEPRRRVVARLLPVLVAALVAWASMVTPSGAVGSVTVADWHFDEAAGARVLVDAGPSGLDGLIGTSIATGSVVQGSVAHHFSSVAPDTSPYDPERLDLVAHDARLNPGDDDVALTVRLRTTAPQGNVVQKGQSSSTGGYMKIDMDDGRVACLFKGSLGVNHVRSAASIADGAWHEVRCVRSADEVALVVDSVVVDRRRTATGVVANTWPVTIAGKSSCNQASVGCDYFSGDIDRVLLERTSALLAPTTTAPTTTAPATTAAVATTTTAKPVAVATVRPTTTTTVPEVVK